MDILGDADTAFAEFHQRVDANTSIQYIEMLGVYQAVQWTVDALRRLATCLKMTLPNRRALEALTEERAWAAGHPLFRRENGMHYDSFIHRSKMSPHAIEIQHVGSDEGLKKTVTYSPIQAVANARRLRDAVLTKMAEHVVNADRVARFMNGARKLSDCFHPSTDWMLQHVAVAPYSEYDRCGVLSASVQTLCEQLQKLIVAANNLDLADVFPELIRDTQITVRILEHTLDLASRNEPEPHIELIAFSESAVSRVNDLVDRAREIDRILAEDVLTAA